MNKKILIILPCIFVSVIIFIAIFNAIKYPVSLKIDSGEIASARIEYYGDGVSQDVIERKDIEKLIKALNKLRFKENEDMSHLSPRSGILIVDLYNDSGECVDSIQFYEWVYRGGEADGKERKDGVYLSVKKGLALGNIYKICDEICGDPFDSLEYNSLYWLMVYV